MKPKHPSVGTSVALSAELGVVALADFASLKLYNLVPSIL